MGRVKSARVVCLVTRAVFFEHHSLIVQFLSRSTDSIGAATHFAELYGERGWRRACLNDQGRE
jgi:hypothetical protein